MILMIRDMRDSVSSWPVRIILIILIIAFAGFAGSRTGQKLNTGEVAQVNGEAISSRDFSFRYQNLIQSYQRQGRLPADVPEAIYNMLKQQLLNSMIYEKLKAAEANRLHLDASNDTVKETVKKQFSDQEGNFDFKFYQDYLRNQMGKSPGQYETEVRENLRADLFQQFILETGLSSNLQLKQSYQQQNKKVVLSYVKINPKNTNQYLQQTAAPSEEELKKYYQEHPDNFMTKEKRKLNISYFEKKDFPSSKDFSHEAQNLLNAAQTEKKDARLKQIQTDFINYDDHVGHFSSTELTEILNSTLNLENNKNTYLTSRDGQKVYLIELIAVQPAEVQQFAKIKDWVRKTYLEEKNKTAFDAWIRGSWTNVISGKESLSAFAQKNKLTLSYTEPFEFSSTGKIPALGTQEEIMNMAFKLTPENAYIPEPVKMGEDYVLVGLKKSIEPDWKKFDAEKENLANVLHRQAAQTRFSNWMESIEKKSKIKRELQVSQAEPISE